jgi:hypothetical protein
MSSSKYRKENPEKVAESKKNWYAEIKKDNKRYTEMRRKMEDSRLRRKFGISISDYEERCVAQDGKCLLCGKERKLVIDHCHKTGKIRGLLCRACNGFLGMLGDDGQAIIKLQTYLNGA